MVILDHRPGRFDVIAVQQLFGVIRRKDHGQSRQHFLMEHHPGYQLGILLVLARHVLRFDGLLDLHIQPVLQEDVGTEIQIGDQHELAAVRPSDLLRLKGARFVEQARSDGDLQHGQVVLVGVGIADIGCFDIG